MFAAVSCVRDIGRDIGGLTDRGVQLTFWACYSPQRNTILQCKGKTCLMMLKVTFFFTRYAGRR